jgi:hypothetical protein
VDPSALLNDVLQYNQGNLFTRAGNPQNFSGRRQPFIASDPVPANVAAEIEALSQAVTRTPGQLDLPLYPPEITANAEYFQGNLFTRAGNPQNFRRGQPFIAFDPVVPNPTVVEEINALASRVAPGQLSIPGLQIGNNPYRPGATIRATGPGMADIPELHRFTEYAPERQALNLLNSFIAQQGSRRIPAAVVEDVARVAAPAAAVGASAVLSRAIPVVARMGAPGAAAGLGLAAGIAASKVLADSGAADKVGNELKYMAKLLGRGKLPYTR